MVKLSLRRLCNPIFAGLGKFSSINTVKLDCDVHLIFKLKGGEEVIISPVAVLTKEGYKTFAEPKPSGENCYGSGHEKFIEDFYLCVKENKPFVLDFKEGARL